MERSSFLVSLDLEDRALSPYQDRPRSRAVSYASPVSPLELDRHDSESESEFPQRSVEETRGPAEPTTTAAASHAKDYIENRVLKQHKSVLWIAGFYVALTSTEWILACLLAVTPLVPGLDYDQTQQYAAIDEGPDARWSLHENSIVAIRALAALSALLALPVASSILARTSVALARANTHRPKLTLRQTLAYVDRAWTDPVVLFRTFMKKDSRKQFSVFLGGAYLLCTIGWSTSISSLFT